MVGGSSEANQLAAFALICLTISRLRQHPPHSPPIAATMERAPVNSLLSTLLEATDYILIVELRAYIHIYIRSYIHIRFDCAYVQLHDCLSASVCVRVVVGALLCCQKHCHSVAIVCLFAHPFRCCGIHSFMNNFHRSLYAMHSSTNMFVSVFECVYI